MRGEPESAALSYPAPLTWIEVARVLDVIRSAAPLIGPPVRNRHTVTDPYRVLLVSDRLALNLGVSSDETDPA